MTPRPQQRGYLLISVVVTLFLLATVAVLLTHGSALNANSASSGLEADRAEYVAQAGMQHALWQIENNACMGEFVIPDTMLGNDSYSASISGAAPGTAYVLSADQDAWIRNDDTSMNNGKTVDNHIRQEGGRVEQVLTRFDLSGLPANAQINSAVAWFYVKATKEHPEGPIHVHEVTADWAETSVTWDSFGGAYRSATIGTIPAQDTGGVWVSINLTGLVQSWVNGRPNYGILFESQAEGVHAEYMSREDGANPPRLEVVVGSGPASPVQIQVIGALDSGVKRTLIDANATARQPPGYAVLQPGAEGKDGWANSAQATDNYGVTGEMTISGGANPSHFLVQFPVERIPGGSHVVSARLEMYLNWLSSNDPAAEFSAHSMTQPWAEGSGDNWNPGDGANWNTSDGSQSWDWQSNHDASAAVDTTVVNPGFSGWHSWDVTGLVGQWVSGERPNYGLVVKGNANALKAWFRSSDYSDPAQHPRLIIQYACECGTPCMAPNGAGRIALIGDDNSPDSDDQMKIELFESWGYQVDFYEDRNSDSIDWSSYSVAYVSETAIGTDVSANLDTAPIGVVNEEPKLYDDLLLASGDTEHVGSEIKVVDNSHFITSVFTPGQLSIYTGDMEILTADAPLASDLQILGEFGGAATLTALDQGARTTSGIAAGRRVTLPLGQHYAGGFDWAHLNNNGLLIIQRAIDWGMGAGIGGNGTVLMVVGNAGNPSSRDAGKKLLMESWGYEVTLLDDNIDEANFKEAIQNIDVIYVSGSVTANSIVLKLGEASIPLVNEERDLKTDYGFSENEGYNTTYNTLTTENPHYITEPFAGSDVIAFTSNVTMWTLNGAMSEDLAQAGNVFSAVTALATLDVGTRRWDGLPVSARRVQVPFENADVSDMTADGQTLMRRSIEWALGAGPQYLPIAHWKLDETSGTTAVDSEGGHNGTLTNGPVWSAGMIGGGLEFDGIDDAIVVPHDDTVSLTGAMTFSAWVRSDAFGQSGPYDLVISKGTVATTYAYYFGTLGDEIIFGFSDGPYREFVTPDLNLSTGTWHHIAATFDSAGGQVSLYHNGFEVLSETTTYTPSANTHELYIGSSEDGADWDGLLDDVRIYERVLSAEEVAELAERPPQLLLVVGNPSSLSVHDTDRRNRFQEWGYNVSLIDDSAAEEEFDDAVSASDVIYLTSTVSWSALDDKLEDADKGLVNQPVNLIDDFGFGSSFSFYDSTGFSSTDAGHFITSPYGGGAVTTFSTTTRMYVPSGTLAPDLVSVGSSDGGPPGAAGLATLESGASTYDGGTTPARRVHLPMSGISTSDMTAEGRDIMRRAIEWAAGAGGGTGGGGGGGGGGAQYIEVNELFWPGTADSWETVDLGTYGVPATAVVEIAVMNNDGGRENWVGARAVASGLERRFRLHEAEGGGYDTTVMHVQADANSRIQTYADRTNSIAFTLLGYWTGASYVEQFDCFTASGSNSWREHDFGNQGVGPNQIAEVAVVNTSTSRERLAGVRPSGSSMQRRFNIHEAESGGVDTVSMMIETDGSAIAEVYASSNTDIEFCVVGSWSTPPGTYTEHGGAHSQMTQAANWQSWNLASFGVPANSVVQVVMTNDGDTAEQEMGVRSMGSAQGRLLELQEAESGGSDNVSMHVVVDGNARIEAYSESGPNDRYFYPVGWWVLN